MPDSEARHHIQPMTSIPHPNVCALEILVPCIAKSYLNPASLPSSLASTETPDSR